MTDIVVAVTPQPAVTVLVQQGAVLSASNIGTALRIDVANIDDPSAELAAVGGTLAKGTIRIAQQTIAGADAARIYMLDDASSTAQSTPNRINRTAGGQWVLIGGKGVAGSFTVETSLTVGSTLAVTGLATLTGGLTTPAVITSTIATGTAPFAITSTTVVPNLNASLLLGNTWAAPGAIGGTTPGAGTFTAVTNGALTSGRVTFASTAGLLADDANLTFTGSAFNSLVGNATFGSGSSSINLNVDGGAGSSRTMQFKSAGSLRWLFQVNSTAEGGANAGSDFQIVARTDAGGSLGTWMQITRSTGVTTFAGTTDATSSTAGGVVVGGGIAVAKAVNIGSTAASTSTTSGGLIVAGGIGTSGQITFDGSTSKSLRVTNGVANGSVAVTFGSVGPTGSTAGNAQGWLRISVAGTDRYIPFW